MRHSTGKPTKAEQARFSKLHELGCIACRLNGHEGSGYVQIHHLLSGNKRRGHDATIPLCPWCHTGMPFDSRSAGWFLDNFGPSYHRHKRAFQAAYGSDDELLAMVNELIGEVPA